MPLLSVIRLNLYKLKLTQLLVFGLISINKKAIWDRHFWVTVEELTKKRHNCADAAIFRQNNTVGNKNNLHTNSNVLVLFS